MPLSMIGEGETATITRVGGKEETRRFLENLGFVVGAIVTVISKTFHIRNGSFRYRSIRDIHVPYLTSTDIRVCG